jgi:CRISPR type I-E-associated protein CasB/Cse2
VTDTPIETAAPTTEPHNDRLARERSFIGELAKQDNGRLAMLRRNAGNSLAEARGVAWFYGLLGRFPDRRNEEAFFLIATLFAADKGAIDRANRPHRGDFGATLRALRNKSAKSPSDPSPLDRRFNTLLDADFDPANGGELAFRLRQMTKRIIAEKDLSVSIDWPQLLLDVKFWSNEKKTTQKNWARSYYAPAPRSQESTEEQSPKE